MRKIFQTTILSCVLASSASASIGDLMYVRGDVTFARFNSVPVADTQPIVGANTLNIKGGKYIHKYNFGGIFGLGYNVNEKLRTEIIYNKIYVSKFKFSNRTAATSAKIKANIIAFLGRIIYDVLDVGPMQAYVGAGVGVANVRHKVAGTAPIVGGGGAVAPFMSKSKNRNNFAYMLMLGTTTKVTDSLHVEVGYTFSDYGPTSNIVGMNRGKITLRSHNLSVGFRFDLM